MPQGKRRQLDDVCVLTRGEVGMVRETTDVKFGVRTWTRSTSRRTQSTAMEVEKNIKEPLSQVRFSERR